jgi:hypothetical protein
MLVCDGLKGLPDAVATVWPATIVQTCVVHLLRNSFRHAARQDWDKIAKALKPVYTAPAEDATAERFLEFAEACGKKYPAIVRLWENAWAEFVPFLAFDVEIRKVICSTNARALMRTRPVGRRPRSGVRATAPGRRARWAVPSRRGHGGGTGHPHGGDARPARRVDPVTRIVQRQVHLTVRRQRRLLPRFPHLGAGLSLGGRHQGRVADRHLGRLDLEKRLVVRQPGLDPAHLLGQLVACLRRVAPAAHPVRQFGVVLTAARASANAFAFRSRRTAR